MSIVIRDLAGVELQRILEVDGEIAQTAFSDIMEEEDWVQNEILEQLNLDPIHMAYISHDSWIDLNIPKPTDINDINNAVFKIIVNEVHTYNITLEDLH